MTIKLTIESPQCLELKAVKHVRWKYCLKTFLIEQNHQTTRWSMYHVHRMLSMHRITYIYQIVHTAQNKVNHQRNAFNLIFHFSSVMNGL